MSEPPELPELLGDGDDSLEDERDRLRCVDGFLRSVPGPPAEIPPSLTRRVLSISSKAPARPRRRIAPALALAAALAVAIASLFFTIGSWLGGDELETRRTVTLQPTENAPAASGLIRLGARDDESGNWEFIVEVEGLPPLSEGGYYVLWLAKDGAYAAPCGTFNVGGRPTAVHMSASYRLADFDEWVISGWLPHQDPAEAAWLLRGPTT